MPFNQNPYSFKWSSFGSLSPQDPPSAAGLASRPLSAASPRLALPTSVCDTSAPTCKAQSRQPFDSRLVVGPAALRSPWWNTIAAAVRSWLHHHHPCGAQHESDTPLSYPVSMYGAIVRRCRRRLSAGLTASLDVLAFYTSAHGRKELSATHSSSC